jgi:cytochrome P450
MRQLRPRVRRIVLDHLLAMVAAGPPADLVGAFALPIPSLVICELLGVPYEDRGGFQALSRALLSVRTDPGEAMAAGDNLTDYMSGLVRRKRAEPTDDMLSGLVNPQDPANELTEEELTSIGSILLIAGHETTANMISLSVFMLLQRRGTWEGLVRAAATTPPEEESAASASVVEELLRHLSVVQFGLNRTALEDVELGGQLIRAGEVVIGAVSAANHDPERFPEPDRLELDRARPPHVAFGHGVHQCLGQQLARLELRTVFTELPRRLPTLRLAVPAAEVPMKHEMIIYGAAELPVEWDLP